MNQELYFIPILARALEQPDPRTALNGAFREIDRAGQRPEYREGYDNFQRFMEEVIRQAAGVQVTAIQHSGARELIAELATDTFEGAADEHQCAHELAQSRPEWAAEYEALRDEITGTRPAAGSAEILVVRDRATLARIGLSEEVGRASVSDMLPGMYSLLLDTGRLIWEGELTEQHLIWNAAFPGRALDLAAATGEVPGEGTREEVLLDGELVLRVFPGLEAGRLELQLKESADA